MIEPGLLRVFRGYALLRLVLGCLVIIGQFALPVSDRIQVFEAGVRGANPTFNVELIQRDNLLVVLTVVLMMVLLCLLLFSNRLENKLGGAYIPIALLVASLTLFLEQYLLTPRAVIWQADSFFFILLILVAWQYSMRSVLIFSVLVGAVDFVLSVALLPTLFFISFIDSAQPTPVGPLGLTIFFGRQTGRILSFLVVGFVITSLVNAQRRQRKELSDANQALVEHAGTLEQLATSRERNRLSRELHDTVAHTLSGLTVQLEALQTAWRQMPAQATQMVEKMLGTTRSGLNETRRTLKNLRASQLDELGLTLGVQALAQDAASRKNMKLQTEIEQSPLELPVDVGQAFYRIAQEALENIVRHSGAKTVWIKLLRLNDHIEMSIRDDGHGFDQNDSRTDEHWGTTLMKERADLIGAQFSITSQSGKGTTVRVIY